MTACRLFHQASEQTAPPFILMKCLFHISQVNPSSLDYPHLTPGIGARHVCGLGKEFWVFEPARRTLVVMAQLLLQDRRKFQGSRRKESEFSIRCDLVTNLGSHRGRLAESYGRLGCMCYEWSACLISLKARKAEDLYPYWKSAVSHFSHFLAYD